MFVGGDAAGATDPELHPASATNAVNAKKPADKSALRIIYTSMQRSLRAGSSHLHVTSSRFDRLIEPFEGEQHGVIEG